MLPQVVILLSTISVQQEQGKWKTLCLKVFRYIEGIELLSFSFILSRGLALFPFLISLSAFQSSTPLYFQLQRLKRSLSFRTKSIRSKSADNFFRTSSDNKTELLSDVSSSTGHLCNIGMAPPHNANISIPPVPPAIPSAPPPTSRSQSRNPLQVDSAGHCFMEHIFKKPTFCDVCNHMIVGTSSTHLFFLCVIRVSNGGGIRAERRVEAPASETGRNTKHLKSQCSKNAMIHAAGYKISNCYSCVCTCHTCNNRIDLLTCDRRVGALLVRTPGRSLHLSAAASDSQKKLLYLLSPHQMCLLLWLLPGLLTIITEGTTKSSYPRASAVR